MDSRGPRASVYRLWFAVQEVIHHDDVMCPIIIRARRSIAARDSHSGNPRVGKDDAQEGQTSVARRGWDEAAEDQPPVGAEALDACAGLTVSVFIAGPTPIRKVNVREDRAEATNLRCNTSIGSGHEEQCLGDVAVYWSEQPLRTEGAKDGADAESGPRRGGPPEGGA